MKRMKVFAAFLSLVLTFTACEKDDSSSTDSDSKELSGSFEVYMNDELIEKGTTDEVGMFKGLDGNYKNTISINNGTVITILVSQFPITIGESVAIDSADPGVSIGGWDIREVDREEFYFSTTGTITRISGSKISFEGVCREMLSTDDITFSGYVESEAFKNIQ